jgi:hypothetical protein
MSMDRLRRVLNGGTLVLMLGTVVAGSGCRSMRNEVPPQKPYPTTGGSPPTVGFNSDPHPNSAIGGGLYGNAATPGQTGTTAPGATPGVPGSDATSSGLGSSPSQYGTPAPGSGIYGQPTSNRYGPSMTPGGPGSDTGR